MNMGKERTSLGRTNGESYLQRKFPQIRSPEKNKVCNGERESKISVRLTIARQLYNAFFEDHCNQISLSITNQKVTRSKKQIQTNST